MMDLPRTKEALVAPFAATFAADPAVAGLVAQVGPYFAAIRRDEAGAPALVAVEATQEAAQAALDRVTG